MNELRHFATASPVGYRSVRHGTPLRVALTTLIALAPPAAASAAQGAMGDAIDAGEAVIEALTAWDRGQERDEAVLGDRLVDLGPVTVAPLCRLLDSDDAVPRVALIRALTRLGDRGALPSLQPQLANADPAVRAAACRAIGRLAKPSEVLEQLVALVDDADRSVALAAGESLRERSVGDESTLARHLLRALPKAARPDAFAELLGALRDPVAEDGLVALLDDERHQVSALAGLSVRADRANGEAVLDWFERTRDRDVRKRAALCLGRIRHRPAVPSLIEWLDDVDRGLAANCHWALQQIAGRELHADRELWQLWFDHAPEFRELRGEPTAEPLALEAKPAEESPRGRSDALAAASTKRSPDQPAPDSQSNPGPTRVPAFLAAALGLAALSVTAAFVRRRRGR